MDNKKLSLVLKANAIFSIVNGFAMLFFSKPIANFMGIDYPQILLGVGVGLILFGALVYKTASDTNISEKMVKFIIIQDWIWVAGSALLILTQAFGINRVGFILIGVVALIVADFAFFQQRYLKAAA